MTTINCSSDCIHQRDGRCTLESAISGKLSIETDCVFYEKKPDNYNRGFICKPPHELL